jgi:2-polyprenyl-3-methyl-5-hydroxy-6-metoxy-1,4-benzoquinol methylase
MLGNDVCPSQDSGKQAWPSEQLEHLGQCPVCGSKQRELMFQGLSDEVFKCAPGRWTIYRCHTCTNAYLDPRPSVESIGKAYENYYTHTGIFERDSYDKLNIFRRCRRNVANGYTNIRYGTRAQPASRLLGRLLTLLRPLRHSIDLQYRWLPRPQTGAKLLDVGCGNGAFLNIASSAGWMAYGADPDPASISRARAAGFNVKLGGISAYSDMIGKFDAITFSHSIEHVHQPKIDLMVAYSLLRPGGVLYVDTPDFNSPGCRRYKEKWRGIEAPRHLVIFSSSGLKQLLADIGFTSFRYHPRYSVVPGMNIASMMLAQGFSPDQKPSCQTRLISGLLALRARVQSAPEFITLTCKKEGA